MNLLQSTILLSLTLAAVSAAGSVRGTNHNHRRQPTKCYNVYSNMAYNSLMQAYVNNPDDQAQGFATCELCTNGTIHCDANVYGGETPLIASHFHLASDDDGMNGNGPPVINFCGSNKKGMINDGTPYEEECMPYMNGNSVNTNMTGVMVMGTTHGESIYDLVTDIGTYPEKYYLNFHSLASWSHWLGHGGDPMGMCRGVLVSYGDQEGVELEEERD